MIVIPITVPYRYRARTWPADPPRGFENLPALGNLSPDAVGFFQQLSPLSHALFPIYARKRLVSHFITGTRRGVPVALFWAGLPIANVVGISGLAGFYYYVIPGLTWKPLLGGRL